MKPAQIVKTLLAGVGVAVAGVLAAYVIFEVRFFTFILCIAAGYGAGTLIHRAGGRNGGPLAMIVSGVAVALAFSPFLVQPLLSGTPFPVFRLIQAAIAIIAAVVSSR